MTKSAYIHIPFCKSKCNYCSFVSFADFSRKNEYLEALKLEIQTNYKGEELETLYFGGGTPSLLSIDEFRKLIGLFNITPHPNPHPSRGEGATHLTEITTEINPEGITLDYLKGLKALGINRISIGSQSFDDQTLKLIGRKHKGDDVKNTVKMARNAGFDNISLDFIYGLPNQKIEDFVADLKTAIGLDVEHISLYGLKIEKGCYFYKNKPQELANLDEQADMYLAAIETLTNNDFKHYEISNFSKKGFESRHNLTYWDNKNYYGFGLSASGYENATRYTNQTNLSNYIKNPLEKLSTDELSTQEILEEEIFLGLRKLVGINIKEISEKFGIDFDKKYKKIINKFLNTKHMQKTPTGYSLTISGVLISNEILSEFIEI